ncbi:MAG: J domain-containing protein [Methylovulum sp.]|uniref:J domain-containing protein n=1 Tax=Methylovulum sp. TaxID=1916980 RepID=UPI002623B714|nr:J domain-containing protein [Methylovulum sp.]MDD2724013.1 J domain-containing protein [Methylovulum sp.]
MANIRTHYDNLKVARNAPVNIIKAAYKALWQTYHPDKFQGGKEEAERIMKIVTASYAVLSDPVTRAKHDAWILEQEAKTSQQNEKPEYSEIKNSSEQQFHKRAYEHKNYSEEDLYEIAGNEISSGMVKQGIMAKALVETNGDDKNIAARYIQLRVMALKTELLKVINDREMETEQFYIQELTSLGCKISSNISMIWKTKKWKITTKQNEVFELTKLDEFQSVINHCKQKEYEEKKALDYIQELTNLGCAVTSSGKDTEKKWKIVTKQNEVLKLTKLDEFQSVIDYCLVCLKYEKLFDSHGYLLECNKNGVFKWIIADFIGSKKAFRNIDEMAAFAKNLKNPTN